MDLDAVQAAWIEKGDAFFSVTAYDPVDGFTFADPLAEAYFKAKGHVVSHAVAAIADSFRGRGLEVGMDLNAPFMAQFVGQDYGILSQHADFIKPMLYRQTLSITARKSLLLRLNMSQNPWKPSCVTASTAPSFPGTSCRRRIHIFRV